MAEGEHEQEILTLEPLLESVREGVQEVGWELSGLQKTTSHRFEGRWEGDSTRSAYLFFHRPGTDEPVSVDVYLDETSRGLKGNLALVLEGREPQITGRAPEVLEALGKVAARELPEGYRTPVSIRYRIPDGVEGPQRKEGRPDPGSGNGAEHADAAREGRNTFDAGDIDVEVRIKLRIPDTAIEAGQSAVSALSSAVVGAFEKLLEEDAVAHYCWLE